MRKIRILSVCFCVIPTLINAADNLRLPDIRTLGMGGNGVTHTALFNPALLALHNQKELQFDYYNRYSLKELATISGAFVYPNAVLPMGLHVASFGYDAYRESMFRGSWGKQLNTWCSLGIGIQYALLQSELFETDVARLSTDIGITLHAVDNWLIGLSIINFPSIPLSDKNMDKKHITPFLLQAGINWQFINDLLITAGGAYTEETPFSASAGMEYMPFADFHLRTGIQTAPFRPSLGASYRISMLMADVVMVYHPILGISTGIGLSFTF